MRGAWLVLAALEAEEEDSPSGDVEEESEADAEGCEEHGADGLATPNTRRFNSLVHRNI